MAHQSQLENKKYRNWVKAGLGLKYTKEGLEPFCDKLVKQQHVDILSKVKKKHSLSAVNCGTCDIKTLQPDHVRNKTKDCPLDQFNCNCQRPGGKIVCPNNVCGAIYDEIIQLHASTPPSPYWKNTDAKQWCTEPWAIAKSFINAPGYETKLKASEVDCVGLIHVLINNRDFQSHLNCTTNGPGLLQKVRRYRNIIYHSHDMELEGKDVTTYIDDMIAVLQDRKELINLAESKSAVDKLRELKREDFVITTTNVEEIHRAIMADIKRIKEEADKHKSEVLQKGKEVCDKVESVGTEQKTTLEQMGKKVGDQVESVGTKQKSDLDQKGQEVVDWVESVGTKQKSDLDQKGKEYVDQIERLGQKQKAKLDQKGKEVSEQVESMGTKQKSDLEQKGKEVVDQVESVGTKRKFDLEQKGNEVVDQVERVGTQQKSDMEHKATEIGNQVERIGKKQKTDLDQKGKEVGDHIESMGTKQKSDLEQKGKEVVDHVESVGTKQKFDLEQKGNEVVDLVESVGTQQKSDMEHKATEVGNQVERIGKKQKTDLDQKGKEVGDHIESMGTKQKAYLEQKGKEFGEQVESIGTKQKTNLEQKGKEVCDQVESIGTKQRSSLEQKGKEVGDQVESIGRKQETNLEQTGKEVGDQVERIGTKQKNVLEQKREEVSNQLQTIGTELKLELEQKIKGDLTKKVGLAQHEPDYESRKAEYQKKLVDGYMQYAVQVSSLPLQPDINRTNIENMCVPPWMTVDIWDESSGQTKEVTISMHEIFHNVDKPVRNIYILGEAGSGKTTLCKMLVYYWCVAHSERKARASESRAVKVMENYDFLFYLSLRHYSDHNDIENMLDKMYPDPVLRTILQNESHKCLILLDGLDEWTPQNQQTSQFLTPGLPTRKLHAAYTIITTTRRWKFDTLKIKNSEKDKKIKLKGISGTAVSELIETTVKTLNDIFHENKAAAEFLPALEKSSVEDVSHVPMILQQLICLWFDNKLRGTSKCAIYSSMLDLFFGWRALKYSENIDVPVPVEHEIDSRLPQYLNEYEDCFENKRVIYHMSRLAYKTLFDRNKENMLTFSNSTFQELSIPGDVKTCSLKVGILSEDKSINLFASRRQHTSFTFVHKSMQEFLGAVYVAIKFETMIQSLDKLQKDSDYMSENCKQCVRKHFVYCKTVVDILEQSNVFIMLCGLEPQLLPYISEYIYNSTTADKKINEERKITKDEIFEHKNVLQNDIQKCIFSCVGEALSRGYQLKDSVSIADIVLNHTKYLVLCQHGQLFKLHSVLTVDINLPYESSNRAIENVHYVLNLLTECDSLKTFKYNGKKHSSFTLPGAISTYTERIEQQNAEIIARNKLKLETISLISASKQLFKKLIQIMPDMIHLISFQVTHVTMGHKTCRSLCTILEQSVQLQQIRLDIFCNKRDEHTINLTKHKQLQYLDLQSCNIYANSVNTESLVTCKLHVSSLIMIKQVNDCLHNACMLKHLEIVGSFANWHDNAEDIIVTDYLFQLLRSLTSLSTVKLSYVSLTGNNFMRPSCQCDMKNLKEIKLWDVTMSKSTWCTFVDSLQALPKTVHVQTWNFGIIDTSLKTVWHDEAARPHMRGAITDISFMKRSLDEAERRHMRGAITDTSFIPDRLDKAAREYIREKTESFRVTRDDTVFFEFVTNKAEM